MERKFGSWLGRSRAKVVIDGATLKVNNVQVPLNLVHQAGVARNNLREVLRLWGPNGNVVADAWVSGGPARQAAEAINTELARLRA